MTIWIDADAAPREVKEIVFRAGKRLGLDVVLVANRKLEVPPAYPFARSVAVADRADSADRWIAQQVEPGDVVVTADIALAAAVVPRPASAIDPRGREYTADDVGAALSLRDFMEGMRGAGMATGGPPPWDARDSKAFAATLDRVLARALRGRRPPS